MSKLLRDLCCSSTVPLNSNFGHQGSLLTHSSLWTGRGHSTCIIGVHMSICYMRTRKYNNWASGSEPTYRSFGLAYRNCLRASFYAIFQFFLHWHCMHWPPHSLERTWASQLRQSMLTRTSTAHGDPSLAAPMLTTRFSYTHGYGGACTSYIALYLKYL